MVRITTGQLAMGQLESHVRWQCKIATVLLLCAGVGLAPVRAEILVSANHNGTSLVDGKLVVVRDAAPDTVAVILLDHGKATLAGEVEVPTGVVGPPFSIAMTPDERLALVTAPLYVDSGSLADAIADDTVSVIDLKTSPPRVIATVVAGKGAAGLSITPDGKLALVANRRAGTVSVLAIEGQSVTRIDTLHVAAPESGIGHVAISPDGKMALVTRAADNTISVLAIEGRKVTDTKRDFGVGLVPYGVVIAPNGRIAVVANVSMGRGDNDTLSVIDMRSSPLRAVSTFSVGQTPEAVTISPDGRWCAVALLNGSNKPKESPFFNPGGKLVLFRIDGVNLTRVAERPIGAWPQGAAFAADSRTLLVGSMIERNLRVFRVGRDGALTDTGARIALKGGNAAIRAAEPARR